MTISKRKFTLEFKLEAARRVIDSGRSVRSVTQELSIGENSLSKWVRDERRRLEAIDATSGVPLTIAERAELIRLRRDYAELEKDNAFLKKSSSVLRQH
jgi:transposase